MSLTGQVKSSYDFGPFRLNPSERKLLCDGEEVRLTPKQFDVLVVLVETSGNLVTKQNLMDRVWPDVSVNENAMAQVVSSVRKALKKRGLEYISTVSKHGYRFVAEGFVPERKKGTEKDEDEEPSAPESQALESVFLNEESQTPSSVAIDDPNALTTMSIAQLSADHSQKGETPPGEVESATATPQTARDSLRRNSSTQTIRHRVQGWLRGEDDAPPKVVWLFMAILAIFLVLREHSNLDQYAIPLHLLLILIAFSGLAFLFQRGLRRFASNTARLREQEDKVRRASGYDNKTDWATAKQIATIAITAYKKHWYGLLTSWGLLYIAFALAQRPDMHAVVSKALSSVDPQVITSTFQEEITSVLSEKFPLVDSRTIHEAVQQGISRALALGQQHVIPTGAVIWKILAAFCNNLNSLMLVLGYMILSKLTVVSIDSMAKEKKKQYVSKVPWRWPVLILVVITLIETVLALTVHGVSKAKVLELFDWLSGITGGIALALYVGRLQSRFLSPPHSILILALYLYAAIQPLYPLIDTYTYKYEWVPAVILYAALILKGVFCYYAYQVFQSGRLLFYFVRVRRTNDEIDREWNDFQMLLE